MSAIRNQRAALTQAKHNEDASSFVFFEAFALGGCVGWLSGEWLAGIVVWVVFLGLLSIPYIRAVAALVVSVLWGALTGGIAIEVFELAGSALGVVGFLAFIISLSIHFSFITWSKDMDAKDSSTPTSASDEQFAGADEKECPVCAEWIKKKAVKCRYCGHDFRDGA